MKTASDNGSSISEGFFSLKAGALLSNTGQKISDYSIRLLKIISDTYSSASIKILEAKTGILQFVNKEHPAPPEKWEDKDKRILLSIMRKTDSSVFSISAESGIMGLLAVKPGAEVLELGCGDGFETKNFYAVKAHHVTAIDSDVEAIAHAVKINSSKNITYKPCDFTRDMTVGQFDTVIWQKGPELFTRETASRVISLIKMRLNKDGILTGSSILSIQGSWISGPSDIEKILSEHFSHVKIKESSTNPDRLYFYASESEMRLI